MSLPAEPGPTRGGSRLPRWSRRVQQSLAAMPARRGAVAAALAVALALLWAFDPSQGHWPRCPFRALTGFHCPGCGSLRGLHHALHGELRTALQLNALLPVALLLIAWALAPKSIRLTVAQYVPAGMQRAGAWALLAAVVVFGILRNLPVHPFALLAPG